MILPNTPPWGHMTQITIPWEQGEGRAFDFCGELSYTIARMK